MMFLMAQASNLMTTGQGNENYIIWGAILFAVAIVLLVLEMFIPSGGLIGALCGIAAIGSIVSFFRYDTMWGFVALGAYIVFGPILIISVFKFWLNSPVAKWMILGAEEDREGSSDDPTVAAEQARHEQVNELRSLIGARGTTVTSLRPVGVVKIEGRRVDAMAESGIIEADSPIVVVDVYDNQIKVRRE